MLMHTIVIGFCLDRNYFGSTKQGMDWKMVPYWKHNIIRKYEHPPIYKLKVMHGTLNMWEIEKLHTK